MSRKPVIGFAGMTHLGVNSAVAAAQKGFHVVGFDQNNDLVSELQSGKTNITEPELPEMLKSNSEKMEFSGTSENLGKCDIVYISLDVPTNNEAASDLTPVHEMIGLVSKSISEEALLVVLCQVPPGFTRSIDREPSKLYYQVETLIFGRALERALQPERYIIGCADPTAEIHPLFLQFLQAYQCPILPMKYESAELAKTAINLFLAASVCTANSLAEICEKIGADWQEIIPALRLDKRIGEHAYINPGLGLSGGNIERDLKTVAQIGYEAGAKVNVPNAYMDHSQYRKKWSVRKFYENFNSSAKDLKICILGLTYKENTHSVKNSPAVDLINSLPDISINAYDPVINDIDSDKKIKFCKTAETAAKNADMLFVMTPWDEFKALDWNAVGKSMKGKILIDPYRVVPGNTEFPEGFKHIVLGRPS